MTVALELRAKVYGVSLAKRVAAIAYRLGLSESTATTLANACIVIRLDAGSERSWIWLASTTE